MLNVKETLSTILMFIIFFSSYDTTLLEKCVDLCESWVKADEKDLSQFSLDDISEFSSNQVREFLASLLQEVCNLYFKLLVIDQVCYDRPFTYYLFIFHYI